MDDNRLVLCNFPEPRDWALKVMEEILTRHPTARTLRDEGNIVQIQDDDFVIVEADNPLAVESIKITSKRPSMIFVVWPENMSEWHADRTNKREPRVWIHPRSNVKNWDAPPRTRVSKRKAKKEEDDEEPVQKKKRGRPRKQVIPEGNDEDQKEEQEEVQDKKQKKKDKKEKKKTKEEPQASTSMVTRSSGRTFRKTYEEFEDEEVEFDDEEEEVEDSEVEEAEEAKPEESVDEVHEEAEDVQTKEEANVEVQDKEEEEDVKAIESAPTQKMVSEAKMELEIKEAVSNSVQNQNGDQITTNGNLERPNPSSPTVPVALVPNVAAEDWSRNIYGAVLPQPANNVQPTAPITETPKRPVGRPRKNKDGQAAQNGGNGLPRELNANSGNNQYAVQQAQAPAAPAVPNQAVLHHEQDDQARRAQAERARYEQLQHHNGFGFGGLPGTSQQQYRGSMGAHQGLGGYTYPGYSHHHQGVPGYFGCGYSNAQTASSSNAPPAAGPSGVAFRPSSNGASTVPRTADYGAFAGGMNAHPHGYPGAYHEAYGGAYPGSPNQFSARVGSNQAANAYPGSSTHLAGQPGFNQGANGYDGAPNHLAARPGQGAAAYPGTLPGAHQGYGAYGGYAAGYPEPYHGAGAHYGGYPAANPGAAAYPYPADPVNPDANQGAVNNAGAERWNDGRNL
ncbi:hypothetical protein B9Z55_025313 [Caenorhabditis nigoni]|uniref:Uncharacterized protein n=1 Tax=Caenorhabditis nigoni TaxID=1611254 RepID=A0A2G5SYN3_9PELO|nr:hypothetical protein B9Z55_025313 [Caenorhabditis nigoni]